jgi:hypothetical protein
MSDQTSRTSDSTTGSTEATPPGSGPLDGFKAELERVKHTADDVKTEIKAATDDRRGGPATSVDDATAKAAKLRDGISRDVAALRTRVPEGEAAKQQAIDKARIFGPPVGGGILALTALIAVVKSRGKRKRRDAEVRGQALALARAMAQLERERVHMLDADDSDGGGGLPWLVLGSAAAAAVAGFFAYRSRQSVGVDDVFGAPQDDPLRPSDVVS